MPFLAAFSLYLANELQTSLKMEEIDIHNCDRKESSNRTKINVSLVIKVHRLAEAMYLGIACA
jgi:hypothetical protein